MKIHLQVIWRAVVFGLGAYAVVQLLIFLTARTGIFERLSH
jgi:hypothetical protein